MVKAAAYQQANTAGQTAPGGSGQPNSISGNDVVMRSSLNADKHNLGWAFFTIAVKGALDPAGGRRSWRVLRAAGRMTKLKSQTWIATQHLVSKQV